MHTYTNARTWRSSVLSSSLQIHIDELMVLCDCSLSHMYAYRAHQHVVNGFTVHLIWLDSARIVQSSNIQHEMNASIFFIVHTIFSPSTVCMCVCVFVRRQCQPFYLTKESPAFDIDRYDNTHSLVDIKRHECSTVFYSSNRFVAELLGLQNHCFNAAHIYDRANISYHNDDRNCWQTNFYAVINKYIF